MTNFEVAVAGFILLSISALLAALGKIAHRLRFVLFGVTCLAYLCFLMWHQPTSLNPRNVTIVLMAITWVLYETLGENTGHDQGQVEFRPLNFIKDVVLIFLATAPILLVIIDRELSRIRLVEGAAIGVWFLGMILKITKYKFSRSDTHQVGTYFIVWSYFLYALGTHGGMIAIFAPFLILKRLFKMPHLMGNANIVHEN